MIQASKVTHHGNVRFLVRIPADLRSLHGCTKKFYDNKADADAFAKALNNGRSGWDTRLITLPDDTQGRLLRAMEITGGIEGLESAVTLWQSKSVNSAGGEKKNLIVAMKECMAERDGLGLNVRHVREMRRNLKSFSIGRETRSVCEITAAECRDWLGSHGWGQQTKRNVYVRVAAFFNWAVAQKYLSDSPWKGVIKPGESDSPIGILTPDEARKCLAHVATADPGLLSYYAIGMFAGIRPAEMERLTPANFQDGFIVLREDQTKTGKRRLVEVTPTLAAWLKFSPTLPPWRNLKHRIEDVRKAMGIAWPKNCMRHSFCSYAMALPDWGATRTSKSAGNSEKVMLECYQELVRPVAAAKFWASTPDVVLGAPTNIVPMATAV